MDRVLVALPGAHNAAVATLLYCLLLRARVKLLSSQRGVDVLDAIEEFGPSTVLGFAGTFGEMAAQDLSVRDLSSVEVWFNTGDAAHEAHIRALVAHGSHEEIGRDLRRHRVEGSVFIDGLGSSEVGYSIFHNRHTKDTAAFSRCVGKPISFAEAAVLAEDGSSLPPGEIGRLGLRSPTLTPGYWNDSLTFHRLRLGGYWLTGDLAYQDEQGNFYHLDRVPDAIRTQAGIVFSTRTEELLLRDLPGLDDCTVVGVAPDGVRADWDGDGLRRRVRVAASRRSQRRRDAGRFGAHRQGERGPRGRWIPSHHAGIADGLRRGHQGSHRQSPQAGDAGPLRRLARQWPAHRRIRPARG